MREFSYENQGNITYLVLRIDKDMQVDTMTVGMLTNNKIPGLAATVYTQIDETRFLKYNVSSKVPASQILSGIVNRKRLVGVFSGILEAMLSAEEYMIEPSSIVLDLDYIFTDVSTCETVLICAPDTEDRPVQDLGMFFKQVMFSSKFDQTENCDYIADILNYLNSAGSFIISDFRKVLKDAGGTKPAPAQTQAKSVSRQGGELNKPPVVPAVKPADQGTIQPQSGLKTPLTPPVQPQVTQEKELPKQEVQQEIEEKTEKMSFMYLLRHYTKENAELYKEQNKKSAQPQDKPHPEKPKTGRHEKPAPPPQNRTAFAVPGDKKQMTVEEYENMKQGRVSADQTPVKAQAELPVIPNSAAVESKANFGNTTVLSSNMVAGETTVLGAGAAPAAPAVKRAYLIRKRNNEKILISKPVYRIGKERSYVDYFMGDNAAISRSHANIIERSGSYFIVDTNSTNHTYVDGQMIQSNVETPIASGASIRLANEDFDFLIS